MNLLLLNKLKNVKDTSKSKLYFTHEWQIHLFCHMEVSLSNHHSSNKFIIL